MKHLLYVEDDPNSRSVVQMGIRLDPGKFTLSLFEDSVDFEQKLLALTPQPDLILLDIYVNPISGFEMLKIIRTHSQYDQTPVVALTASVMSEEIHMLQTAGFHGVISKPLNIDIFGELLQRIIAGESVWHIW